MKTHALRVGIFAAAVFATTAAVADETDKAACLDAASKGQILRDDHKLVLARDQLLLCARQVCPVMVQEDCGVWLGEVERSLPTVVLTAKDRAGIDVVDIRLEVDGKPFAAPLDGRAVAIDPGSHLFHFELADGTALDRQVLVKEGEKNQSISVILGEKVAPVVPVAIPVPTAPPAPPTAGVSDIRHPLRTAGFIGIGTAAAGLAVGGISGALALSDGSTVSENCPHGVCKTNESGVISSGRTLGNVSTAAFIAAGAFAALGTFGVFYRSAEKKSSAAWQLAIGPWGGSVLRRF